MIVGHGARAIGDHACHACGSPAEWAWGESFDALRYGCPQHRPEGFTTAGAPPPAP